MRSPIFSDRYAAVVTLLAELRKDAGLTQVELATRLDRPQSYVSKVERRERRIDPAEFHDWAAASGASPADAFARLAERLSGSRS
jgi:transcriptional regulator with XRE-family HTH domain